MSDSGSRFPLLLFALLAILFTSRPTHHTDEPPAFFVTDPPGLQLALVGDWSKAGIHQFFDDPAKECVTILTKRECEVIFDEGKQYVSGDLLRRDSVSGVRQVGWIPAAQRMALQIPLHPDRMKTDDWPALNGIGKSLANAIENDRQYNGDFVSVDTLLRVRGIGQRRLEKIRRFFVEP